MAAHEKDAAWTQAQKKSDWNTFFGRFSEINLNESLTADKHSQRKLEVLLGEKLPTVIETEDDMSSPRERSTAGNLTIGDRSPIEIILKGQPPIGNQTVKTSVRRKLFPSEEERVAKIPLLSNRIKVCECTITREDIKAAHKKKREKGSSAFNGLSAKLVAAAWGTDYTEETKLEFLHLIAKAYGGKVDLLNMAIGSVDANTEMFIYERNILSLLKRGLCQYVVARVFCTLRQKANSSEFTHHAETIQITYETDNGLKFESPVIDANLTVQPSVAKAKLIQKLIMATQSALLEKGIESCIAEMNARVPSRADEEENTALNSASSEHPMPRDTRKEPFSNLSREDEEIKDIIPPDPRKSERLKKRDKIMAKSLPLKGSIAPCVQDLKRPKRTKGTKGTKISGKNTFFQGQENLPPNVAITQDTHAGPENSAGAPSNGYSGSYKTLTPSIF